MRISRGRDPVSSPTRVRDTDVALERRRVERRLQRGHLADGADPGEPAFAGYYRETGRIVTAVFQAAKSFHENRHGITFRDHSDDSAHSEYSDRVDSRRLYRIVAGPLPGGLPAPAIESRTSKVHEELTHAKAARVEAGRVKAGGDRFAETTARWRRQRRCAGRRCSGARDRCRRITSIARRFGAADSSKRHRKREPRRHRPRDR
jgi:hypothetical protein